MAEWEAVEYPQISGLQAAMADEQLTRLDLERAERIPDVGCGDGKTRGDFRRASSPRFGARGRPFARDDRVRGEHFGTPTFSNLRFEVADVRCLPYESEFHLVVSFNALHWVTEQDEALRSIGCVL